MASSAPSSPRPARLTELRLRPQLVSSRSIPSSSSSPSSPTRASTLLSPRSRPDARALPMPPSSTSSVASSAVPSPPPSSSNVAGMLRVEVMSARNLHAAVLGSLLKWTPNYSNPYVVVTLHRDEFTTTTKDKTLNPTWKEMGQLKVPLPSEQELLQTAGMHRSIHDTGVGHSADSTGKLGGGAVSAQKLHGKNSGGGGSDFHACYPHLHVQVYHGTEQAEDQQDPQQASGASRRATDQLIGEVTVPVLPCLLATSSSHRAWYTLLSDEHPDAGQIQIAMHYDVGGLEPLKGDIVRLAGFCGMEYYSKLVNANARLEVADVFQDEVVIQCKSIEGWMLTFELHRNLLFVVRRPSILRDAQSQLQGQIVRVRHSPFVTRVHGVWQAIPVEKRHQLHQIYDLALYSGGAVYGVVTRTVRTTVNEGVHAGVHTCMTGSTEAVNLVSMEAVRVLWRSHTTSHAPTRPTRAEEMKRHLEGGPIAGRGKIVPGFGEQSIVEAAVLAANGTIDEEEKSSEISVVEFVFDEEDEEVEAEAINYAEESEASEVNDDFSEEHKTNDDDHDTDAENEKYWIDNCPDQLLCPITGCPMLDPVVAADGHSYEREAILQWFATSNKSPMTGAQMPTTQVFPNFTLRKLSEDFQAKMQSTRAR